MAEPVGPDRRTALGLVSMALTCAWSRAVDAAPAARATSPVNAERIRAGGRLVLRCPGATAFRLEFGPGGRFGVTLVLAHAGEAVLRVPVLDNDDDDEPLSEWTPLRVEPLGPGLASDRARVVQVLTAPVAFGV
jgi:hypothetical protein